MIDIEGIIEACTKGAVASYVIDATGNRDWLPIPGNTTAIPNSTFSVDFAGAAYKVYDGNTLVATIPARDEYRL